MRFQNESETVSERQLKSSARKVTQSQNGNRSLCFVVVVVVDVVAVAVVAFALFVAVRKQSDDKVDDYCVALCLPFRTKG